MAQKEDKDEKPWRPRRDDGWQKTVDAWPWKKVGPDWVKTGVCPNCEHLMTVSREDGQVVALGFPEEFRVAAATGVNLDTDDEHESHFAYCNCTVEHPERPSDLGVGCGTTGNIKPPSDE